MNYQTWITQLVNDLFPLKYLAKRWRPSLNTIRPGEPTIDSFVADQLPSVAVQVPQIYEMQLPPMHYESPAPLVPDLPAFAEPFHATPALPTLAPLSGSAGSGVIEPIPAATTQPGLEELIALESPQPEPMQDVPSDFAG